MADTTYVTIPELTEVTTAETTDYAMFETAVEDQLTPTGYGSRRISLSSIASYTLNSFRSLSLGGVYRTVKAAIDAIVATVADHTILLGNSSMGTTATTVTGAVNEVNTKADTNASNIATLNSNLPLFGFVSWSDVSVPNGSFITNTGNTGTGVTPLGTPVSGVYNMGELTRGRWLVIFHARFKEGTNTTGLRGLRVYVNEASTGDETFIAPSGNGTDMRTFYIINNSSDSNYNVRMGLYQGSGAAVTATSIWIIAVKIGNL